jgi:hypothetical protein
MLPPLMGDQTLFRAVFAPRFSTDATAKIWFPHEAPTLRTQVIFSMDLPEVAFKTILRTEATAELATISAVQRFTGDKTPAFSADPFSGVALVEMLFDARWVRAEFSRRFPTNIAADKGNHLPQHPPQWFPAALAEILFKMVLLAVFIKTAGSSAEYLAVVAVGTPLKLRWACQFVEHRAMAMGTGVFLNMGPNLVLLEASFSTKGLFLSIGTEKILFSRFDLFVAVVTYLRVSSHRNIYTSAAKKNYGFRYTHGKMDKRRRTTQKNMKLKVSMISCPIATFGWREGKKPPAWVCGWDFAEIWG